ncbi:MAG: copper amine oxidase N-terminal domain-containing protein [Firmicutes bacterium]|nr:copper amine oxidase N-terminal domain-containing protein [Bacillota bacterium]
MRKYIATVIIAFLIGLSLTFGLTATAATNSGSSADPLVAKSWVDDFVEQQFAGIKTQLTAIKEQISNLRTEIVIYINKKDYTVNGESRTMDTAAVINSDWRTMVPLRFVAEALGCTVDYTTNSAGSTTAVFIRK